MEYKINNSEEKKESETQSQESVSISDSINSISLQSSKYTLPQLIEMSFSCLTRLKENGQSKNKTQMTGVS